MPRRVEMGRPWKVIEQDPGKVAALAEAHNLAPILAKCILNRDVLTYHEQLNTFLSPEAYEPPDPYLMPDMDLAVTRIIRAIHQQEKISIYGDYDADGVTAISILLQALRELGAQVSYYIPDRFFEGVGLQIQRLKLLHEQGVDLIITVDTGVRAFEEMRFAKSIGLDIIVTDHHTPSAERPDATAVLNPKLTGSSYPFRELCGAGVALKVVQGLDRAFPGKLDLSRYIQIAAIGTIADMVPLLEENRWIVYNGLKAIDDSESGPIRNLLRRVGVRGRANALDISFRVAPRINAPGRLGDPDTAIAFFETEEPGATGQLIDVMDGMNRVRQNLEKDLEKRLEILLNSSFRRTIPPFVMLAGRHWHRGILGIMACKMLRRFNRPVCVVSFDAKEAHGSIRGTPGIDLMSCLQQISSLLSSFGGHPEAAGVSLPVTNLPQFKDRMIEMLGPQIAEKRKHDAQFVDAEIKWRDVNRELFFNLGRLAPFGIGNSSPVLMTAGLILETDLVRRGPWFHFEASDGHVTKRCSFYHPEDLPDDYEKYDSVDLIYSLVPYRENFQIQIVEMQPSQD